MFGLINTHFANQVQHSEDSSSTREFQVQHKEIQVRHQNSQLQREFFFTIAQIRVQKIFSKFNISGAS